MLFTFCSLFCNYLQYSTAHGDKLSKLLLELYPRESNTYYISAIFCFVIDISEANDYSVAVVVTTPSYLIPTLKFNSNNHFLVKTSIVDDDYGRGSCK